MDAPQNLGWSRIVRYRALPLVLLWILTGCTSGTSGPGAGDSAGGGDAEVGPNGVHPEAPAEPTPPATIRLRSWTCPEGWDPVVHPSLVDENDSPFTWCEPPPLPRLKVDSYVTPLLGSEKVGDRPICEPAVDNTFPLLGHATCQPLGSPCPTGDWPELPADVTGDRIHVMAGATGGDGSAAAPYGTIASALAVADAGDVILLGSGVYSEAVLINEAITLWGRCVTSTIISAPTPDEEVGTVEIAGSGGARIANLTIHGERPGIWVRGTAQPSTLESLLIARPVFAAVFFSENAAGGVVRRVVAGDIGGESFGIGLGSFAGGEVTVDSSLFERARILGVVAFDPASLLTLDDVAVRETLSNASGAGGRGLEVTDGASVTVNRALFERNHDVSILASDEEVTLNLDSVVIRETQGDASGESLGAGLSVQGGARGTVVGVLLERNYGTGILVQSEGTQAFVEDVVVTGPLANATGDVYGTGLQVTNDGWASVRRSLVEGTRTAGVMVAGESTWATFEDLAVRETAFGDLAGDFGLGMIVMHGAGAFVHRGLFERNHYLGIGVDDPGSRLGLTDLIVRETLSGPLGEPFGRGLSVQYGAEATVVRAHFHRNRDVGIGAAGDGTTLHLEDLRVTQTQSDEESSASGRGLELVLGASVTGSRILLAENHDLGIFVNDDTTHVTLEDLTVRGTRSKEATHTFGGGMQIRGGAQATLTRCLFTDNRDIAAGAFERGTTLSLDQMTIASTNEEECASLPETDPSSCSGFGLGNGVGAYGGATVSVNEVRIIDSAFVGLQLARQGSITGQNVEISTNLIGVNIQEPPEGYDFFEAVDGLIMSDNAVNFDSLDLQIPDAAETLQTLEGPP